MVHRAGSHTSPRSLAVRLGMKKGSGVAQVVQPVFLFPPAALKLCFCQRRAFWKKKTLKKQNDGHCCLVMNKKCGCHSWVKGKSQTKAQLQILSRREVSSEEVKNRQGTFWRQRAPLISGVIKQRCTLVTMNCQKWWLCNLGGGSSQRSCPGWLALMLPGPDSETNK